MLRHKSYLMRFVHCCRLGKVAIRLRRAVVLCNDGMETGFGCANVFLTACQAANS